MAVALGDQSGQLEGVDQLAEAGRQAGPLVGRDDRVRPALVALLEGPYRDRHRLLPSGGLLVEFRRITNLPPYVFTIIDGLKVAARRAGEDVIDLGFGNPDLPSPEVAVDKLADAARNPATTATRPAAASPSSGRPPPDATAAASASSSTPTPR